ncbi:MAG: TetR/AcrR family transcriptional regulator [Cyanobacteria bacterium Co-bin13]|nr:TetR/AcrR family transcriptional regulator [Cyanobacteria bacterium Co-bin13]
MGAVQNQPDFNAKAVQILKGAMQEFLQNGYAGTSMDKVAATAKVSKPTVYSHFRDKEGLFQALVQYVAQQRCLRMIGEGPLQGDPAVVLRQVALETITTVLQDGEYQDFVRLVVGESGRFPLLAEAFLENLTRPGLECLTQYLADHPELGIADPAATARVLLGTVVFFTITQGLLGGETLMPMAPERLIDSLMQLLLRQVEPLAPVGQAQAAG